MPRLNDEMLNCVFYLYRSRAAAETGEEAGGTGFWAAHISHKVTNLSIIYAVSNKHVVATSGCSVIRVNTLDGGIDTFEAEPHEWYFTDQDDLAIAPIRVDFNKHIVKTIPLEMFVTPDIMKYHDLGLGDEVFMIGRFIKHDGKLTNIPSVRFGALSIPVADMPHQMFGVQESFGVEMRSMCGYSGSPVFIYPSSWNMNSGIVKTVSPNPLFLLGVDGGYIVDALELKEKIVPIAVQGSSQARTVPYVPANTGMNGIVPAWRLLKMIQKSPWTPLFEQEEDAIAKRESEAGPSVSLDVAPLASDENPNHREDFTSLLSAAARKREQER
jgi:hypothetical protein